MIRSCNTGSKKLEEREGESPRGGMDVVFLFYSRVDSSIVGEDSRFQVHPSREVVTAVVMQGELLA